MATENHVAIVGKPVTSGMVDHWVSADDMVSVLAIEPITNGVLCGNALKYDEICIDIDCASVAGILILETKDGEQVPDLRFRQFPVKPGSWCERDNQYCLTPCIDIIDDCCHEPEPEVKEKPWCIDWCQRWYELQCKYDRLFDPITTSLSGHGRSKTVRPLSDKMCEKLEAEIRKAKANCLMCKGMRSAGSFSFRRINRHEYRRR